MAKMVEHQELVSEIAMVEKMSTQERLKHARKRRAQQLKRWAQYEKHIEKENNKKRKMSNNKKQKKNNNNNVRQVKVQFQNNIMLLEAAARNDLEEVRNMLSSSVNPDVTNEDGLTALHQCCIDDCEEMMKLLLEFGANVNAQDSELWTPLHAAATCGHLHLCKYLIEKGADLLSVNADGNMPYDICEDDVTLEYIESEMASKGVTQELIDDTRLSVEKKMLNDLKSHHASGGDLEFRDRNGATPLHIAAANGYLQVAEFLLEQHVSVDLVDSDSWQPIHAAACWGHLFLLELLVQNGADIEAKTKSGETPYDICEDLEMKERIREIQRELESHKAIKTVESKHKHRHSTRSMVSSASSIYSSNTSLSEKNAFSSSIRRVSMREKSAISWREAREEAKLRDSATMLNVDDEEENSDMSEKQDVSEKTNIPPYVQINNRNKANSQNVPASDIDDVNVVLPSAVRQLEQTKRGSKAPKQSKPQEEQNSRKPNTEWKPEEFFLEPVTDFSDKKKNAEKSSAANDAAKKVDQLPVASGTKETTEVKETKETAVTKETTETKENTVQPQTVKQVKDSTMESVKEEKPEKTEKAKVEVSVEGQSVHMSNSVQAEPAAVSKNAATTSEATSTMPAKSKSSSSNSLDSVGVSESGHSAQVPHGTLADLKKQRAQQLRNSQRYRDHANLLNSNQGTKQEVSNAKTPTASEAENKTVLMSNGQNGSKQAYQGSKQTGEPPKHKFTAQKTEVVGGDEEKQQCCVIL